MEPDVVLPGAGDDRGSQATAAATVRYSRWELRACGRHGHETYRPDGVGEERLATRLRAHTTSGEAWRCLRCGDYVVGPPRHTGPADEAPLVLRGKALRQATILRILALERGARAIVLIAVAYAILRFKASQGALLRLLDRDLPAFRELGTRLHVDVDSSAIVRVARHALTIRSSTLSWLAVAVTAYAVVEGVEAVGLWRLRRWGEYFTVVATAAFIPLELYELSHHLTATKLVALGLNVAAVVYLVVAKRLFGVRGGLDAFERERRADVLLEIERAATSGS